MYYDFRVKIPDEKGKIYTKTIKGVVYINYEYDRVYKPDKKYNIPKRTTIGKISAPLRRGDYNPTINLCIAICKALDRTLDELFWES